MLLCSVPPGARRGKTNIHCLHQHIGTQTGTHGQTPLSGHTFVQSTTGRTAGKTEDIHTLHPPLHRHTMHTHAHARTRTRARTGNENGGVMVKSGNIKVNLRSGVAVSQERTRTHARTRNGILLTFPRFCVCCFCVLLFAAFMPFSDVVLPCLLTVWACFVGGWWCGVLLFRTFCKCLYLHFEPFLPNMYVFFAATDKQRREGVFLWRFRQNILYTIL